MFIGHFALGFAAKRVVPRVSLAVLFAAAQLADLLWPIFVAVGLEQVRIDPGNTAFTPLDFESYPWSHSLLMVLVWAALLGGLVRWRTGEVRAAVVAGALVVSHWVLDLVTHRPDLPLWPAGPRVGLGLWNSVPATVAVEALLFAGGAFLYGRTTRWKDGVGRFGLYAFLGLLLLIAAGNLLGPPPPSVEAIGWAGLGLWLFVPLAGWIDRHRLVRETVDPPVKVL
jgi:membrane-bound metal-dependent hydrolase YbcI (DUF457 family)